MRWNAQGSRVRSCGKPLRPLLPRSNNAFAMRFYSLSPSFSILRYSACRLNPSSRALAQSHHAPVPAPLRSPLDPARAPAPFPACPAPRPSRDRQARSRQPSKAATRGSCLAELCRPRIIARRSALVALITRTLTWRVVAAEALELAGLQHAQQLHLALERQVADLVEEQRAAVGRLERALARARSRRCTRRPRRRTAPPRSARRQRADVDLDERPARAPRELAWMISASFSLPEPFGPVIRTGTSARATWRASVTTPRIASLSNTMPRRSNCCASARARGRCAGARAARSSRLAQLEQVAHRRQQPRVVPRLGRGSRRRRP